MTEVDRTTVIGHGRGSNSGNQCDLFGEYSRDAILLLRRADGRILDANPAATTLYGYRREELLSLAVHDLRSPNTPHLTTDQMFVAEDNGLLFETLHRRSDGATFPVEVSSRGADIDGERVLISVIRDISERRRAEEALRRSEERYRLMFQQHVAGFALHEVVCDRAGAPCDATAAWRSPVFPIISRARADSTGRRSGVILVFRDQTEERRAQQALRLSQEKYRQTFENVAQEVTMFQAVRDEHGEILDWIIREQNRESRSALGPTTPVIGQRLTELRGPDAVAPLMKSMREVLLTGTTQVGELDLPLTGKQYRGSIFKLDDDTVVSTGIDITESRRTQEALRQSEMVLRATLDASADGILVIDDSGRVLAHNGNFVDIWRFPPEVLATKDNETLLSHAVRQVDDPGAFMATVRALSGSAAEVTETIRLRDGRILERRCRPLILDSKPCGRVWSFRDVTDQRRTQDALRRREQFLDSVLRTALDGFFVVDARARILDVNDAYCAMSGYTRDELLQMPLAELVVGIPPQELRTRIERNMRLGRNRFESRHRRKDGRIIDVEIAVQFIGTGTEISVCFVRDITEVKRSAAALQESEERFKAAFQTSPDAINLNRLDDGLYIAVNDGFSQLLGWTADEVLGRTSLDLEIWDDPADRARLMAGLKKNGYVRNLEASFRTKDGRLIPALMSARVLTLGGGEVILSITRDVTDWKRAEQERRRLEEQLHQSQKLESIGRLAGGIAHDFNNLLTVVLSCSETLKDDVAAGAQAQAELIDEIHAAGKRAAELTRQLLAFARKQAVAAVPLDLNTVVGGTEKMLRRVLGDDIELCLTLQPALWNVCCDPGQLEQVILNLAVNARDAMPGGGRLLIATSNTHVEPDQVDQFHLEHPGDYVRMVIRDSGTGMTSEVLTHVFEPFFTTKPRGAGTGLGLATVHGIIRQSGGQIHVASEVGEGTAFQIYLPRTLEPTRAGLQPAPSRATRGSEPILVVEDDAAVREVTVRSLRGAGYQVLVAPSGRDALRIAADELARVSLMITDVVMPGIDGPSLAKRLIERHPKLRVLYVSGYTEHAIAERTVLTPGFHFLHKPFTSTSLLARVRAALDAS